MTTINVVVAGTRASGTTPGICSFFPPLYSNYVVIAIEVSVLNAA